MRENTPKGAGEEESWYRRKGTQKAWEKKKMAKKAGRTSKRPCSQNAIDEAFRRKGTRPTTGVGRSTLASCEGLKEPRIRPLVKSNGAGERWRWGKGEGRITTQKIAKKGSQGSVNSKHKGSKSLVGTTSSLF